MHQFMHFHRYIEQYKCIYRFQGNILELEQALIVGFHEKRGGRKDIHSSVRRVHVNGARGDMGIIRRGKRQSPRVDGHSQRKNVGKHHLFSCNASAKSAGRILSSRTDFQKKNPMTPNVMTGETHEGTCTPKASASMMTPRKRMEYMAPFLR